MTITHENPQLELFITIQKFLQFGCH